MSPEQRQSQEAIYGLHEPVDVFDSLRVKAGNQKEVISLFETEYRPLAEERGLHWQGLWPLPPFERGQSTTELLVHWRYPSLQGLWQARGTEETDQRLPAFWSRIEALVESRTRKLGRPGGLMTGFRTEAEAVASGRPLAEGVQRYLAFVRPGASLSADEESDWVAAAGEIDGVLTSYSGFNEGGWTFKPGEMTWDISVSGAATAPSAEKLLGVLPGNAEIDEIVTLSECLDSGFRNPDLGEAVKRTIFLRTREDASPDAVRLMEEGLMEYARLLPEMVNWVLSRVDAATGPVSWSHCFEQEFASADHILGAYQNHPYHWAVVDRYFHPESHERAADAFSHTVRPIRRSVLAELMGP